MDAVPEEPEPVVSASHGGTSFAVLERAARAVEMRRNGVQYRAIGEALGCSSPHAHRLVTTALRHWFDGRGAPEVFNTELLRLDSLMATFLPKAESGDVAAAGVVLKTHDRLAALYGLNAPAKVRIEQVQPEAMRHLLEERRRTLRLLEDEDDEAQGA